MSGLPYCFGWYFSVLRNKILLPKCKFDKDVLSIQNGNSVVKYQNENGSFINMIVGGIPKEIFIDNNERDKFFEFYSKTFMEIKNNLTNDVYNHGIYACQIANLNGKLTSSKSIYYHFMIIGNIVVYKLIMVKTLFGDGRDNYNELESENKIHHVIILSSDKHHKYRSKPFGLSSKKELFYTTNVDDKFTVTEYIYRD